MYNNEYPVILYRRKRVLTLVVILDASPRHLEARSTHLTTQQFLHIHLNFIIVLVFQIVFRFFPVTISFLNYSNSLVQSNAGYGLPPLYTTNKYIICHDGGVWPTCTTLAKLASIGLSGQLPLLASCDTFEIEQLGHNSILNPSPYIVRRR